MNYKPNKIPIVTDVVHNIKLYKFVVDTKLWKCMCNEINDFITCKNYLMNHIPNKIPIVTDVVDNIKVYKFVVDTKLWKCMCNKINEFKLNMVNTKISF